MKKALSLLVCLVMMFNFAGCSNVTDQTNYNPVTGSTNYTDPNDANSIQGSMNQTKSGGKQQQPTQPQGNPNDLANWGMGKKLLFSLLAGVSGDAQGVINAHNSRYDSLLKQQKLQGKEPLQDRDRKMSSF